VNTNRTVNTKRLAEDHFPSADDLDTQDFQIFILSESGANLDSSSLFELMLKSIDKSVPQETRSGLRQWWSQTIGAGGVGILAYPGVVAPTKNHIQSFDEFRSKWEQSESEIIRPAKEENEILAEVQGRIDKKYSKDVDLITQMEDQVSLSTIRSHLASLGYPASMILDIPKVRV
jgi:hypothetical protein